MPVGSFPSGNYATSFPLVFLSDMAPTVCLAEFPVTGNTLNTYISQRQKIQNGTNIEQRRLPLEQMLPSEIISESPVTFHENCLWKSEYTNTLPNCFILDKSRKLPMNMDINRRKFVARRDFLNIVIRTICLVRRNHILQRRVNALRAETRRFLRSVLNNPENQCRARRSQVPQPECEIVSSSTDKVVSTSSLLLSRSNPTENSSHEVTSTCDNFKWTNNECLSDKSDGSNRNGC